MNKEDLKNKLHNIPHAPGVYQMKDKKGVIIYVGKAKDLHNRVNSYFTGAHDFKTTKLVSNIEDFDFIITKSEKEALILEINLIKEYHPKYNIQFIDDSSYPYIKLTKERYPRLSMARDIKKNRNALYFGPFPDVNNVKNLIKHLQLIYPFRLCNKMHDKLCLYYHLGKCLGPCVYDIKDEVYINMSKDLRKLLNGTNNYFKKDIESKMLKASEELNFEKAQEYKELLEAIDSLIMNKQNVQVNQRKDNDYFAYYCDKGYISIAGFLIRNGIILEKEFRLSPLYGDANDEFINFIMQYYDSHPKPKELIVPKDINIDYLEETLDIKVNNAYRGFNNQVIEMCINNAHKQLDLKFNTIENKRNSIQEAINELSTLTNHSMDRIELFDNSHTSGKFTVASLVVYQDGYPEKNSYRLYKLHTTNNDIESMKEVIYRRYFRLLKEKGLLPDALFVDGGMIQINAAKEILESLGLLNDIKLMGLVKDNNHNTNGLMDINGEVLNINKNSDSFFLLARMQDEVHRRAISYHKKLRGKAQTKSILDEVEGIGQKRKLQLLRKYKSISNIKKATLEELTEIVPEKVARNLLDILNE